MTHPFADHSDAQQAPSIMDMISSLSTLRGCLVAGMGQLDQLLHDALNASFQGDNEAVNYVTAPLLAQQGPLNAPLNKGRLLVALGRIEPVVFTDVEKLSELRDLAVHSANEIMFSSPHTLERLAQLAHFDTHLVTTFKQRLSYTPDEPALRSQYLETVERGIRSALGLVIATLAQKIQP